LLYTGCDRIGLKARDEEGEAMKNYWLRGALLGVSLSLLLAGGVALAQQPVLDVGCGSATIDGQVGAAEWANAATVTLWGGPFFDEAEGNVTLSQNNEEPYETGTAYFLHDEKNLYVGAVLEDPKGEEPNNPTYYDLWMNFTFEDEPAGKPNRWVDCAWESDSCLESDEGQLIGAEAYFSDQDWEYTRFVPWMADPFPTACGDVGDVDNPPGVVFDGAPRGAEAHYEMRINLNNSPLDNVAVGDCFDMRWIWVYLHAGEINGSIVGAYPLEPVDQPDYSGECTVLCLEPCEAEFVPEPGTMALLGGGLAGLAGYATLRLRSGQRLHWRTRE
jgi:hypothetical protein